MSKEDGKTDKSKLFLRRNTIKLRKFDTKVQDLKYKVLREVAREAWNDTLLENVMNISKTIVPGKIPSEKNKKYGIYYAGIWQELGLKETKEAEVWAKDLFKNE